MLPQQPEFAIPSTVALVFVWLVVNLTAVLLLAYLLDATVLGDSRTAPGSAPGDDAPTPDAAVVDGSDAPDGGAGPSTVRCPDCGTSNEPDFQFCRKCVSRLPGGATGDQLGSPGFRRFAE